jgi:FAD/FMN-containing dehydrogenase
VKRRTFVGSAAAVAITSLPLSRALAEAASSPLASEVSAVTGTGKQVTLTSAEVQEFRDSLRGPLLLRGDAGYDQARRIWNGAFDRHPALIARCVGAADVIQAVQFASSHALLVAVRGGGHSLPGHSVCEGGLMIDLSLMNGVQVDPMNRTARVAPGVLLGQFDREAQAFGLATTAGTVSHTGVAGLTLGGGIGRLARKFGLSVDNLLSADLVTANGKLLTTNANQNTDLFWGIRGGGGNFGIVTSFEFKLHPVGPLLYGGNLIYPFSAARDVLEFVADYVFDAPDELWIDPVLETSADGSRQLLVDVCHCGDLKDAGRAIDRLRKIHKPLRDTVAPTPYVKLQSAHDNQSPHGRAYYTIAGSVQKIEPALIAYALESTQQPGAAMSKISFTQNGGAIARIPADATAFSNRRSMHTLVHRASWDNREEAEEKTAWARKTWSGFEPFTRGLYANLNVTGPEFKARLIYGSNLERLVELKTRYDPTNLFRLNPNIAPRQIA